VLAITYCPMATEGTKEQLSNTWIEQEAPIDRMTAELC